MKHSYFSTNFTKINLDYLVLKVTKFWWVKQWLKYTHYISSYTTTTKNNNKNTNIFFNYLLKHKLAFIKFSIMWWPCLFTKTFRCLILLNLTKRLIMEILVLLQLLMNAEDKRNFLAGEISASFENVLKFGLKSDWAK